MGLILSEKAEKQFIALPDFLQKKFRKQATFLLEDFRHPSLNTKKYNDGGLDNFWQARIDKGWRFYFTIQNPDYIVITIINHPK